MPDERELSAEERRELEGLLPEAYRLVGLDPEPVPAAGVAVRAINELAGRLRMDALDGERTVELSLALGCLLGQQWCSEFGWEWRLVTLGRFQGYGVVPAYSSPGSMSAWRSCARSRIWLAGTMSGLGGWRMASRLRRAWTFQAGPGSAVSGSPAGSRVLA